MTKVAFNATLRLYASLIIISFLTSYSNSAMAFVFPQEEVPPVETQSYIEYKGRVIDRATKKPLVFANIAVSSTNISSITNKEGEFSLKIAPDLLNQMIIVSFLGYETRQIPMKDLKDKTNIISLKVAITELSTIKINIPKDAESLVRSVLNNNGENYLDERTKMTAFYRESIKKGRKNASLTEAVVSIFKQSYNTEKKDALELVKSRKNTNYTRLDTLALKLQGGPFSALYSDIIKYPQYIFTEETFPYYKFSFDPSTQINGRQVFVVKFKQLANVVTPLYNGKLYIDSESYALVSAIYELNVENKAEAVQMFLRKKPRRVNIEPIEAVYRVDYKTQNDKWYYSYSNIQLGFKVKWRKKFFSNTYRLNIEMAVTDWNKNTIDRINSEMRLKPSVILSDEASGFSDPTFWGEYNIIEPDKSIESAIKKIAKQLSKIKTN